MMKRLVTIVMFLALSSNLWAAENLGKVTSSSVKLCVGGMKCIMDRSCIDPDSMLGRVVYGSIPSETDKNGYILINGNGRLFIEYIAQWLRRGEVYFLHPADALNTFNEADYYLLLPLKKHIWEWMKAHGGQEYLPWVKSHKIECLTEAEAAERLGCLESLCKLQIVNKDREYGLVGLLTIKWSHIDAIPNYRQPSIML